jgi:phage gp36-like protein
MAFLTQEELKTHIRAEHTELLSRGDDTIVEAAIDGAIEEAYGYLTGLYDVGEIFTREGKERNNLLLIFVKDIAVYHFVKLTQSGDYFEYRQKIYDRAVEWLKSVGRGDVSPRLPRKKDESGNDQAGLIYSSSNPKRVQHF